MPAARAVAISVTESPTMTASPGVAAGARDGPPQDLRIGLLHAERVLAADRGEALRKAERVEQPQRQPFELVGADREAAAARGQLVERRLEARETAASGRRYGRRSAR